MSAPPVQPERPVDTEAVPRVWCRWAVRGLAVVGTTGSLLGLIGRWTSVTNHALLVLAVLAPFLLLGAPLAAVLLLVTRRWVGGVGVATVGLVCLALLLPRWWPAGPSTGPTPGAAVRVMTANLRLGRADAPALVDTVRRQRIDVLLVQELTNDEVGRLHRAGLDTLLPGHELDARNLASGAGLWTRYPVAQAQRIGGYVFAMVAARLTIPGTSSDLVVASVHLPGPWPQPVQAWSDDLSRLPATLRALAAAGNSAGGDGAVVVGGDFNATVDVTQFRTLIGDGYRDAAQQAGAGLLRTFPADSWIPPVIGIDHFLVRAGRASSVHTVGLRGSDHRAMVARIVITAGR